MTRAMVIGVGLLSALESANGHGYLTGPRSRNLLAFEETVWWPQTENDPQPETCPHCLNRGGTLAECGIAQEMRNYDTPKNALGGPMPTNIQATFTQGQDVIVNVTLTAHHKGHFEFAACVISSGELPTKECFGQNKLTFVEDLIYGANYDPNYPHRAYIAPVDFVVDGQYVPNYGTTEGLMDFSFKMRLPSNVYGDLVLLQWYYLTANSCIHDGYAEYNWPEGWRDDSMSASLCGDISPDGDWGPEQFWNCAETRILANSDESFRSSNPTSHPTISVQTASVAIPVGLPSSSTNSSITSASQVSRTDHEKTIVGYYASWQWYDRNKLAAPENMDFTKLQRVNYAFFQTDTSGNLWGTDSWGDPNVLFGPYNWNPAQGSEQYCSWDSPTDRPCNYHNYEQGLIYLVHAAGAEIYPSIGGWTLSDPFPAMAADSTARANFAQNCVDLIKAYDFDGIDIDWEYPGFEEHSGTPDDKANFPLLLDDVRSKLDELGEQTGRYYGLTAAIPCGPSHIANMDIAHVASTLSELNLMTYDFHGAFSETTGTNAPLYYQGWGEKGFSVHDCVENWLAGGGTRDKINIGLPFYGRSFAGATGLNEPHDGADQTVWGIDDGTPQYYNIMAQLPSMTHIWDKTSWTDWAYFESGGSVSYDSEDAICAKTQYAIDNDLNGFIIWELSGDADLSTPLLDVVNKKLADSSYSCGEPGYYPEEEDTSVTATFPSSSVTNAAQPPNDVASGRPDASTPITYPFPTPISAPQPTSDDMAGTPDFISDDVGSQETSPFATVAGSNQSIVNIPSEANPLGGVQPASPPATLPYTANFPMSSAILLRCRDGDSSSTSESNPVPLLFTYELHRHPSSSSTEAMVDVKTSILNDIAVYSGCERDSSSSAKQRLLSFLRSSLTKAAHDYIVAILSHPFDKRNANSPCSVAANIDSPSVCDSMIGSITLFFDKDTPASVVNDVQNDIIYVIRTGMGSGRYESSKVLKVIFIDDLSVSSLESDVNTNAVVWAPQSDETSTSTIVAIILGVLLIVVIGVAQLLFFNRAKRSVGDTARQPENSVASSVSQVEEVWKKALYTYDHENVIDPMGGFVVTIGSNSSDICSDAPSEVELSQEAGHHVHAAALDKATPCSDPPDSHHEEATDTIAHNEHECNYMESRECDESALTEDNAIESPRELTNLTSMNISELKKELEIYGVDFSNLIEKQEFVDAIEAERRRKSTTEPGKF
eukprot:CCRYP_015026-RF/>CCRYP_015026-RF protein AED:0.11 eAED:0.11 QI:481/0.94/0.95/1/0.78/0.75/20/1173/1223